MLRIAYLVGAGDEYSSSHVEGGLEGVQAVDLEDDESTRLCCREEVLSVVEDNERMNRRRLSTKCGRHLNSLCSSGAVKVCNPALVSPSYLPSSLMIICRQITCLCVPEE